jgi:hypothetical protein
MEVRLVLRNGDSAVKRIPVILVILAHRLFLPMAESYREFWRAIEAELSVEIEDDGTGADTSIAQEGNGFANMSARGATLGGSVSVGSRRPQAGTRVVIQTAIR